MEPSKNSAPGFFSRRVWRPLLGQLKKGVTPERLALSCVLGATIGIFPIMGSTTFLCLVVGTALRLNQPAIQAVNYLMYPLQIPLVLVFVRIGERLLGAQAVPLTPAGLISEFKAGPRIFLAHYGIAGLHGIFAWAIVAPILGLLLYPVLKALFLRAKLRKAVHG